MPDMDWISLSTRFRKWKADVKEVLDAAAQEGLVPDSPQWYSGLISTATSFSGQLSGLQLSLQRANSVQPPAREAEQTVARSQDTVHV